MDGFGIGILVLGSILGIICGLIFIIMLIVSVVKKSKKLLICSFIPVVFFFLLLVIYLAWENRSKASFENIPFLEASDDSVTILNYGTGSMGSCSEYIIAEEDTDGNFIKVDESSVLVETARPEYSYHLDMKFGYTFVAKKSGTSYVAVAENDCGNLAYIDIYKITADEKHAVSAEKIKHVDCNDGEDDVIKQNLEEYPFIDLWVGEE